MDGPTPSSAIADRLDTERTLVAELSLQQFRGLRLASLRWAAAVSIPIWLAAQSVALPAFAVWLALLAEAFLLSLAACYAALEHRWARRAALLGPANADTPIHTTWTDWDELRSALWYAMAILSLVLWTYVGFARPLPAPLLSALTAIAVALFLLVVVAETAAQRLATARASPGGADRPPLEWIGHGGAR